MMMALNSVTLGLSNGGAMHLAALGGFKCRGRATARASSAAMAMADSFCGSRELGQLRLRGGVRVRASSGGESADDDGAAMWLREKLPLQLERDGVEVDASRRIAEACADACARFLATGRAFDPMMIMDAMEEEIERRDLRGDEFLPFELGRRAAKVLTERWNGLPLTDRPKAYRQEAYVNKKDVVDFDKWPENLKLP